MSIRGLGALAAALLLLCLAAGGLLAHRLGWWGMEAPVEWTFVNSTLSVARGQRVVLRPILEGVPPVRFTFILPVKEPPTDDPVAPVPHLRAGVEELVDGEWSYRPPVQPLALCQMGAMTSQEWLEEIRPVIEWRGSGEQRTLLRARHGHRNGSFVTYYFDPAKPVPGVGWTRSEMTAEGRQPEVHYATDAGLAAVR